MALLRSVRFPAILLLLAAIAGLIVANSPIGAAVIQFSLTHVGIPGTVADLSLAHWVSDGLLAIFFFAVSVELQYELTRGELRSFRRAIQPAIAAAGGVLIPIGIYLAIAAGSGVEEGWPIPTATDIAFALGVLAVFGRGLPSTVRVFLLALAILDDIVGIVFIAVLFATDVNFGMLALALLAVVAFAILSRVLDTRARALVVVLLVLLAAATWVLVLASGVHATIAGVLLGLAMAQTPALRVRHAIEPWVNALVLPIFAFAAALVPIPQVAASQLSPAFWAILVALPLGKIIGIVGAGWAAQRIGAGDRDQKLPLGDLVAAGALGGIGFTVSLLLANLAFADSPLVRDEAILGVLAGSMVALVLSGVLVSWRARHYRRLAAATPTEAPA
ncbi:Na+/H+ antiporter NhaA [Microbacterium sp. zg.B48]|uniref:Na+/H+ antiporter NhaA n=1 Tax=unclassified Microbacterium TaxID=2609290 RepID=UPI00214C155B|nr:MULTISPECIES: Na+/H+ antiporter NhaA [unclassified Microbacterium]MCR2762316.1 Na+/H+ antiporter NhaA [Microbacterium sp. zg.B48]MCR2809678.1 Na+/H+ antiporter NhaA [Microbacterium sp. zg.B185]WIM18000.1 Na+/H+ antiporter NhaA [Microbacterium sp. zg-B185]